jgi:ketosteroid isomerase-like protein
MSPEACSPGRRCYGQARTPDICFAGSCGSHVSNAWLGSEARGRWLRDTRVTMSRDNVELAKRVVDAYNRRDVDTFFAELATPDFEWWPALTRAYEGGCYQGRDGVEKFAVDTRENWEELQSLPEEFRDLGDRVLVLGRMKGRGKGSGVPVDSPYVTILDFRGDRIWRSRVYLDRAEGLRVAGLSE